MIIIYYNSGRQWLVIFFVRKNASIFLTSDTIDFYVWISQIFARVKQYYFQKAYIIYMPEEPQRLQHSVSRHFFTDTHKFNKPHKRTCKFLYCNL